MECAHNLKVKKKNKITKKTKEKKQKDREKQTKAEKLSETPFTYVHRNDKCLTKNKHDTELYRVT